MKYKVELMLESENEYGGRRLEFTGEDIELLATDIQQLIFMLTSTTGPVAEAIEAPKSANMKTCENPDCRRPFKPRTGTQRICGRPECVEWRKRSKPKYSYTRRKKEEQSVLPETAVESGASWKPQVTIEAGNGVIKGSVSPDDIDAEILQSFL